MAEKVVLVIPDESKELNEEESKILEKVKEHIGEQEAANLPHETLIRFVRGYAFEKKAGGVDKWRQVACTECEKTVAWRKKVDAATLLTRELPLWDLFSSSWATGVFGTDDQGHPLVVERFQDFNLQKLLDTFKNPEELAVYQARNLEYVQQVKSVVSQKLGRLIYKHCYILDCTGLSTKCYAAKSHIQAIFQVAQYNYPETLFRLFIVNAPMVFRAIWAMMGPLIHPITKEKVKVLGGKYLTELEAFGIKKDQLPASIGGTHTTAWYGEVSLPTPTTASADSTKSKEVITSQEPTKEETKEEVNVTQSSSPKKKEEITETTEPAKSEQELKEEITVTSNEGKSENGDSVVKHGVQVEPKEETAQKAEEVSTSEVPTSDPPVEEKVDTKPVESVTEPKIEEKAPSVDDAASENKVDSSESSTNNN